MSEFGDTCSDWESNLPGDELPEELEEDLKANIAKHRQKIVSLKKQLNKEELYVQYLERLLANVQKRKSSQEIASDVTSASKNASAMGISAARAEDEADVTPNQDEAGGEDGEAGDQVAIMEMGNETDEEDKAGFVTVISVNNLNGGDIPSTSPEVSPEPKAVPSREDGSSEEQVAAAESQSAEEQEDTLSPAQRRKVPPKPPPKTFRRPVSQLSEMRSAPKTGVSKSQSFDCGRNKPRPDVKSEKALKYSRATSLTEVSAEGSEGTGDEKSSLSTADPPVQAGLDPVQESDPALEPHQESEPAPSGQQTSCDVTEDSGVSVQDTSAEGLADEGTDIDAVPDDGYGSKGRPRLSSDRRQRVPVRVDAPTIPVQKSVSRDSIPVHRPSLREGLVRAASKDSLGKCSSRESLDQFPVREQVNKYASKESLKDSGTSSPRIASPRFFETKISRSASQSSSGSLPIASTPQRDYMEGIEEPLYDTVAPDPDPDPDPDPEHDLSSASDYNGDTMKSASSSDFETKPAANDTLRSETSQASLGSQGSVGTSGSEWRKPTGSRVSGRPPPHNYVNIDYHFRRKVRDPSRNHSGGDSDDDVPPLLRTISVDDNDGVARRDRSGSRGRSDGDPFEADTDVFTSTSESNLDVSDVVDSPTTPEQAQNTPLVTYRHVVANILESETTYVECLSVMLQYMKALKATITTSQPVISQDDFNSIFFKVPDLYSLHSRFLDSLRVATRNWDGRTPIGEHFKSLAENMGMYGAYLQNYQHALDTVRRCTAGNPRFAEITRCIKLRSLNGQVLSLEELLHRPVARVQQNAPALHDLLTYLPRSHPDHKTMSLAHALTMTQSFMNNQDAPTNKFTRSDRIQRHVVKNSFIVELCDNHRKLRHLFLFNDVLVCAKYKPSGRNDKFTFEVKWLIPLADIVVSCCDDQLMESRDPAPATSLVTLKSQASTVRDQIRAQERYCGLQGNKRSDQRTEKQRKKLAELEAQLVLASPNLPFKVANRNGKQQAVFFLSSDYDRSQWMEAVRVLQMNTPPSLQAQPVQPEEVQAWISTYRRDLQTNMGSYLLRTGRDESLLVGDLHVLVQHVTGLEESAELFLCFEVDSYGHFFRKAKTKPVRDVRPCWNEDFIVDLEGSHSLRILCYENDPRQGQVLRGRVQTELSRSWLTPSLQERCISLGGLTLTLSLKYASYEMTMRRPPQGKSSGLFGSKIQYVCKREKRSVPFIITSCVREVERRGMNETGVYRVSGSATDIGKLKKLFETNIYEAEQLVKEVDIHSVTGLLKLYLRELPEALFTDELYGRFFEAFGCPDHEYRRRQLLQLFSQLPQLNQSIIVYLIEHMIRVNRSEVFNKMSLHNLATVFGPTLLRPGPQPDGSVQPDLLAAGTVDVMAQAGILYFFLQRRNAGEPIQLLLESTPPPNS